MSHIEQSHIQFKLFANKGSQSYEEVSMQPATTSEDILKRDKWSEWLVSLFYPSL